MCHKKPFFYFSIYQILVQLNDFFTILFLKCTDHCVMLFIIG